MATINFETAIATRQLIGPTIEQMEERGGHEDRDRNYWWRWTSDATLFPQPVGDAKDDRVFLIHDGRRCGKNTLVGELGIDGPSLFYITDEVSTESLSSLAERYGLVLDELTYFRDQTDRDLILTRRRPVRRANEQTAASDGDRADAPLDCGRGRSPLAR